MIIEGKFSVTAPIKKLWDTLFGDVKGVAACMPGVENLDVVDDKTFNLTMKQKVGIFSVTMKGPLLLTTVQAPTHLDLAGEFADITKLGQIKSKITLDLADEGPGCGALLQARRFYLRKDVSPRRGRSVHEDQGCADREGVHRQPQGVHRQEGIAAEHSSQASKKPALLSAGFFWPLRHFIWGQGSAQNTRVPKSPLWG